MIAFLDLLAEAALDRVLRAQAGRSAIKPEEDEGCNEQGTVGGALPRKRRLERLVKALLAVPPERLGEVLERLPDLLAPPEAALPLSRGRYWFGLVLREEERPGGRRMSVVARVGLNPEAARRFDQGLPLLPQGRE